ncbi:MAG: hypothetical protein U0930_23380 [Pirellulales bacterium]
MTYARLRNLFLSAAVASLLIGTASLLCALFLPLNMPGEDDLVVAKPKFEPTKPGAGASKNWTEARFGDSLSITLQRPVIDPPVVESNAIVSQATQPPPPQPPQIRVELIGTAIDSDQQSSRAWVKINGSSERLVRPGDVLDGVEPTTKVKLIEPKRIVLVAGGFDLEFKFN